MNTELYDAALAFVIITVALTVGVAMVWYVAYWIRGRRSDGLAWWLRNIGPVETVYDVYKEPKRTRRCVAIWAIVLAISAIVIPLVVFRLF